ncbi:hypothetical protein OURE66S_03939 [Oligella ureolytica]
MNKTYKTVWSDSSGTYVAVSENTRARGKRSSSSKSLASAVVGVVAAIGLSGVAMDAYAATGIGGGTGKGTAISTCTGNSQANAGNENSIAIGCGSVSTDEASRFYNRENPYNNDFDEATGFYAVAVGHNAKGTLGSVAVGQGAEANTHGLSVAIGPQAKAQNVAALAIGPAALATGNTALALGRQTAATADFAQAIGNVAAATGVGSLAVGHSATATGKRAIAIGAADIDNAENTGDQQGTVYQSGEQALSTGQDSIALGAASNATANYALAVGAHSTASGLNSTAMGYYAEATGENSFASGASAKAGGTNSFALGGSSQAIEDNSIAVGVGARANFKDSVALGSFSEVLHDNSIAIGTHSKTNDYTTKEAFLYETGAAGAFATGAVSIGDGTGSATGTSAERRLQNVAAGGLDTDAVNVSQLKMHKGITDKTGDDIATHLGGGSVFNPTTGAISNPTYNIGGNEYSNVETALKATRTEVAAGDNINVVETTGTNGQTIYTVHSTTDTTNLGWNYTVNGVNETSVTLGDTLDFGNTDDNIVITKGADGLEFNLADQLTVGETSPIIINGDVGTIGGLTNTTWDPDTTPIVSGQAATEDQLKSVSDVANAGWNLSGEGANEVNIGPEGEVNFVGDSNITVAQTGADQAGEIEIILNKDVDLGTDGSVVAGGTKISNRGLTFVDESGYPIAYTPSISQDGIDGGMKQITMIDSGLEGQDLADVTGDDIYNAVNVGDLQHAAGEISDKGLQFSANAGGRYTSKLGSIVTVAGAVENEAWSKFDAGQNIMTQIEQDADGNSVIRVALSKDITGLETIILGENGTPGKDGVDGAPGVGIDGKDGSIGITGKDGSGADITIAQGPAGVDGEDGETTTRIIYETADGNIEEVATLNDGLRFVGDDGEVVERKLNETLGLVGGADVDALTEKNIGVVQKDDGSLSIQLAENVDLGEGGTVTIGDTFIDNSSVSTTNLTVTGETKLGDNFYVTNEGDVHYDGDITEGTHVVNKNYVDNSITDLTDTGLVFDANDGGPFTSKLGSTVTVAGSDANTEWAKFDDGQNIMTQIEQDADGNSVIRVALSKDITGLETIILGENGTPGKDGVDGAPGVGIDGKDGSIGITGKDGAGADLTVAMGAPGLDGNDGNDGEDGEDGESKTRIVYEKSDGTTEEVATLNDGLRFVGDDGKVVERKLNETLGLVGGADVDALTENNIGVVQKDDGSLSIQLAENVDLGEDGTVTIGDTFIDNSSVSTTNLTVTGETKLGDNFYVTKEGDVTYTGKITEGDHIVNKSYVDGIGGDLKDLGLNFAGNVGDPIHKNLGETLGIVGSLDADKAASSKNIRTASNDVGELEILLAEDLVLTSLTTGETVMDNNGVRVGDNVSLTNTGLFLTGGPSIALSGIDAGGLTITNVAAGVNNTDAVNVSQLKDVQQNIDDLGDRAVKYDGETGSPKDTITLEGDKGTTITNLADGKIEAGSKDAVNGGQIHNMGESIASGMGGNSKFEDGKLITELNVAGNTYTNVNDALNGVHGDLSTKIENVENIANAGWNVTDAEGNTSNIGPNGSVAFVGDSNITVTQTGADNAGKVEISLSQDLQVNSITATTVNAEAVNTDKITINNGGPIISKDGIDMGGNRITNVAPGEEGTDAVNVDQLMSMGGNLQNQINQNRHDIKRNNDRANAGIAAAMATAGLPQAYLPGKSMVAVAGGVWRGESGMAIGVSTVSENGKWILKGSANTSGRGGAGGTIGAGYQW